MPCAKQICHADVLQPSSSYLQLCRHFDKRSALNEFSF